MTKKSTGENIIPLIDTGGIGVPESEDDRNHITVEEIGDAGLRPLDNPDFVMVAAITDKPLQFGSISKKFRDLWNYKELKAKELHPERRELVIEDISKLEIEIYAVYIDKRAEDNLEWWIGTNDRNEVYREVLKELMNYVFDRTERDLFIVVLDSHRALGGGAGKEIVEDSAAGCEKNIIDCTAESSAYGKHKDMIQTTDSIAREVRDRIRGKTAKYELKIFIKRIRK